MKNKLAIIFIIIIGIVLYALTLRGAFGNPTAKDFKGNLDSATGAFELSPERGRYVHVVVLAEREKYFRPRAGDRAFFVLGLCLRLNRLELFHHALSAYLHGIFYDLGFLRRMVIRE